MPVFATDSQRLSNVVKFEFEPQLGTCRDVVTANDSAAVWPVGTVLGKVTATGKYKRVESSASDGSQVAAAVVIGDILGYARDITVAAATDTTVLAITRGHVILSAAGLKFGASVNDAAKVAAQVAALKALNIFVETSI